MINLPAIIVSNAFGIALLIILLISSQHNVSRDFLDNKLFFTMILMNIVLCVCEPLAFIIDGKIFIGSIFLSKLINSLLFIGNMVFSCIWAIYAHYKLYRDSKRLKRAYPIIAIPAAVISIMSIASCFKPILFTVDSNNIYHRTNLVVISYIVTYSYLVFGVIMIYLGQKKSGKYLFLPAMIFMVPILIGSIVQFLYYGLSLIWPSIAIGLTSLFINVQKENSSVDSLSGLYSRQYLDFYINEKTKRLPNDLMLAGIMLDIDSFKSINDSFGHQVGDDAIRSFGHLLTSSVGNDTFVSRYAGDEFIIITELSNKDDIHKIIDRIHEGTRAFNNDNKKQYTISFSTGYSFLENKEDSVEDFLKRMDRAMYKNKKEKLLHHNK